MSEITPFMGTLPVPSFLQKPGASTVNKDVVTGQQFPSLKIKGKVFSLSKDNVNKPIMVMFEGDQIPAPSVQVNILRANRKTRVFYADSYTEGESDGARPTCFSNDGIVPSNASLVKQAEKCAVCPNAVWGTKQRDDGTMGEGTACAPVTRLAISTPDKIKEPYLLRVPAGSRKNFDDMIKNADTRGIPYTALIIKLSFDPEAASPKLIFKPVAYLDESQYAEATEMYEADLVKDICGLREAPASPPQSLGDAPKLAAPPVVKPQELAQALAPATPAQAKLPDPAPAPAPVQPAKATMAAKPAPAPAPMAMDDLMADLDSLLSTKDD